MITVAAVMHVYEVRPRKDKRGFDLVCDVLPFGRLWYAEIPHAIGYAEFFSRSHDAVIRVYDAAGNVVETHEHTGDLKECEVLHDQTHREIVYRPLQFQKRSQLFICARDETLSVATLNVNDPARWPSHECVTISYAKARRWSCSHVIPRD